MTTRSESRLPALDGVRGVAALTVVISHAANFGMLPAFLGNGAGQMAVGLFFVLSGFLMTYLYAHRPISRVPEYAMHRFARVVPLYLAIVCLSIAFPVVLFPINTPRLIVEHLGFVFGIETLWTIPAEIQFYFVFVFIWLSPRRAFPILLAAQAALAAGFFVLRLPMTTLPFWLQFFLFGSLCGFVWRRHSEALLNRVRGFGWVGWPVLVLAIVALPGVRAMWHVPQLPVLADPITISAIALLFTGSLLGLGPLGLFAGAWARWLGKVSYGVYLVHYPILKAIHQLPLPGLAQFLAGLLATLVLAGMSFSFFEEPLRRRLTARSSEPRPANVLITPSAP